LKEFLVKKIIMVLVLLGLIAGAAFAQTIVIDLGALNLSTGGGGFFSSDFGGGYKIDNATSTKTPYMGGGGFMFMDIKYAEFSMGILGAGGTSTTNTSPKSEWDYSFAAMDMGFYGKYPFAISNKLSLFPLLGVKVRIVLGIDTEEKGEQYEPRTEDLTTFWLECGGGLDVSLTEKIFLRGEFLYGVRLPNELENDSVDANSGSGIDADPLLGHGLSVKIGAGFKF
jgi:hypothetical protein